MHTKAFILGIFLIVSFSAIAIVLFVILIDSIKSKKTLGRQIPLPPEKLRQHAHRRTSRNK